MFSEVLVYEVPRRAGGGDIQKRPNITRSDDSNQW